tara:strand:+ start:16070 stop:16987 length:918 start_codon:yes stop_codon:yes gene_type:complete
MTSTVKPDYWSLLGLSPDSDLVQIKRAFRREARKWHPDLNNNDADAEERFKLINEAYAVLSDPARRQSWEKNEQYLNKSEDPFADGFPSYEEYISIVLGIENIHSDEHPGQIYEETIHQEEIEFSPTKDWPVTSESPPPPIHAYEDLETIIDLNIDEALNGTYVDLELQDGTIVQIFTPPFAGDGWRLRLPGVAFGNKDHFIQLRVQTEEGLRIDGLRVLYRLELLPPDAFLGCAVEIPTITGSVTLQVPPNSSSGRLLRLRGRGLEFNNQRGDQFVEIVIVVPLEVSEAEYALYRRLQELSTEQ